MTRSYNVFLDDVRWPKDVFDYTKDPIYVDKTWEIVRNYVDFVNLIVDKYINSHELPALISFDHDLADEHYEYNLDNKKKYTEKTGYDCAKWFVDHFYDKNPEALTKHRMFRGTKIEFPNVYVHSANPIGASNIMGYINNFLMNEAQPQTCVRVVIPHTIDD